MTQDELVALAKPICDAVGVDSTKGVMSIVLTPQEVYVEFMEHGQRKTVTEQVTFEIDTPPPPMAPPGLMYVPKLWGRS